MKRLTGRQAALDFAEWRPGDQKVYISDILQAKETFGWEPEISPEEGVGRLVQWYTGEFEA